MNTLCHNVISSICEYAPVLGLTCKTFHQPCQLNISDYFTVEGMTWALQYGYKPTRKTFKLLVQHRAPLDVIKMIDWNMQHLCNDAAAEGHLDALKWAWENGCPWYEDICACAAKGGHLQVLKWARKNGCSWDSRTREAADWHGHYEVWKWAKDNGCP